MPCHEGHDVAKKQQSGFGAIISFEVKGDEVAVDNLLQKLEIFVQAQSLGGVESLVNHPVTMTHTSMPDEAKAGVSAGLLRLSVCIESINDLIADLQGALNSL